MPTTGGGGGPGPARISKDQQRTCVLGSRWLVGFTLIAAASLSPRFALAASVIEDQGQEEIEVTARRRLADAEKDAKKEDGPVKLTGQRLKIMTPDRKELGYFSAVSATVYPNAPGSGEFLKKVSLLFDDYQKAYHWIRSTPISKTSMAGYLPVSIGIREGAPDDRGYVSRAARIMTTVEEIDSVPWLYGGLTEDTFLDTASEFNWKLCPERDGLQDKDKDQAKVRDCALLELERGKILDEEGKILPPPHEDKPHERPDAPPKKEDMYQKLKDFLEKNRERNGKLDVDVVVQDGQSGIFLTQRDDAAFWKTAIKFLLIAVMVPLGIWLYKKKKDFDLRSGKII